jgi:hypothetical protein
MGNGLQDVYPWILAWYLFSGFLPFTIPMSKSGTLSLWNPFWFLTLLLSNLDHILRYLFTDWVTFYEVFWFNVSASILFLSLKTFKKFGEQDKFWFSFLYK